ncbi:hypothetical protein [Natrarchaeobius halalkaliphilus]|nr:hypothetical protein [Natrarchaeobius halalkaliphilus]
MAGVAARPAGVGRDDSGNFGLETGGHPDRAVERIVETDRRPTVGAY